MSLGRTEGIDSVNIISWDKIDDDGLKFLFKLARHVEALILEGRIDELIDNGDSKSTVITKRIDEHQAELAKVREGNDEM